jgi:histidinol-phosphatase (PHP family)
MKKTNYHIHTNYCDGQNSMEDMILSAISRNFNSIGISSHAPLDYQNDWTMPQDKLSQYIEELTLQKNKYRTKIQINSGLEIDYYMHTKQISKSAIRVLKNLDYWIGSIHCLGVMSNGEVAYIDDTEENFKEGIEQLYHGNVQKAVCNYYESIGDMAIKFHPDIIGHIDLIKKNNSHQQFFNENAEWYQKAWRGALIKIKQSGSILEINTGGAFRYGIRCLYPSLDILKAAIQLQIPLTIDTDAHCIQAVDFMMDSILDELKFLNVDTVMYYNGKKWISQKI